MKLQVMLSPFKTATPMEHRYLRLAMQMSFAQGHLPFATHLHFPSFLVDDLVNENSIRARMGTLLGGIPREHVAHPRSVEIEVVIIGDRLTPGMRSDLMEYSFYADQVRTITHEEIDEWKERLRDSEHQAHPDSEPDATRFGESDITRDLYPGTGVDPAADPGPEE